MQTMNRSQVLTIEAAAKLYEGTALTSSAIRRLIRAGEIPSRKVGAKYLTTAAAIETWLNTAPEPTELEPGRRTIRRIEE